MANSYDPADFIIPGSDSKGATSRVACRVIPATHRNVELILASKRFPFRTTGDIIRWCIHTGINRLNQMEAVPSVTAQVDAINSILRDEEFNREFSSIFENMQRQVNLYLSQGEKAQAVRLVSVVRAQLTKMPPGYWRDRYYKEMDMKFGELLRTTPSPSIGLSALAGRPAPASASAPGGPSTPTNGRPDSRPPVTSEEQGDI